MKSIMSENVISVTTDVDQEEVAKSSKKYDIVSLPLRTQPEILGRITVDDIVDVLERSTRKTCSDGWLGCRRA